MAITIVNQSVGTISYTIFGGSASGSGIGSGVTPSGASGVLASGLIPSGRSASGISVSGGTSFTSASGVVTIQTSVKP